MDIIVPLSHVRHPMKESSVRIPLLQPFLSSSLALFNLLSLVDFGERLSHMVCRDSMNSASIGLSSSSFSNLLISFIRTSFFLFCYLRNLFSQRYRAFRECRSFAHMIPAASVAITCSCQLSLTILWTPLCSSHHFSKRELLNFLSLDSLVERRTRM